MVVTKRQTNPILVGKIFKDLEGKYKVHDLKLSTLIKSGRCKII